MGNSKPYFFGEPVTYMVDGKGRFNIPSKHRKILRQMDEGFDELGLYLSVADRSHVICFPQSYITRNTKKYAKKNLNNKDRRSFFSAEYCRIDGQGRVLLPEKFGGLEKAVCAANGDVLEIWSPEKYKP